MNTRTIFILRILSVILLVAGFSVPSAKADPEILINEIAWMGTAASANAEWIELYNASPSPVILDGWSLAATDGSPSISLSGTISGSGYFLLERTSDNTLPGMKADEIYSGSLSNSGEHLQLKDNVGILVDDVDASSGWPAGDNVSKQTMQRSGSGWITGVATPDAPNVTVGTAATTSSTTSGTASTSSSTTSATASSDVDVPMTLVSGVSDDASVETTDYAPDPTYSARMVVPDFSTAGTPVPLVAVVRDNQKRDMTSGRFEWSMGDGKQVVLVGNGPLTHTFRYPGTYTVVLTYYSNWTKTEPDSVNRKQVLIVPAALSITGVTDDGGITLENDSTREIDLAGWILSSGQHSFVFPRYTIIGQGQSFSVTADTLGFKAGPVDTTVLMNPGKDVVARYPMQKEGNVIPLSHEAPDTAPGKPRKRLRTHAS